MNHRELPAEARQLLERLNAPPRLVAHLTLVHDVAANILGSLHERWPRPPIDDDAVLFGAATHDIGKVLHPAELVGPGRNHERDGPDLLAQQGGSPARARFARTHGTWKQEANLELEDLVVALADTCWKGKRDEDLESLLVSSVARLQGIETWEAFAALDEIVATVAAGADERLAWQGQCNE